MKRLTAPAIGTASNQPGCDSMQVTSNRTAWLTHRPATTAAALFAVALSGAVFAPLLTAYFKGDDFKHLFQLANYDLLSNLVIQHGGHAYAVRNFVFFLCWRLFGMNPIGYHALALITHMVNVALLFGIIYRLTGSPLLAAFGAALWGTCPVQGGVLEWYSVYGHALAATVLLVLLYQIAGFVRDGGTPSRGRLWAWLAIAIAGTTCFGVGLAIAMALPFVILLFLPGRYRWWRPPLLSLLVIVPLLYTLLMKAYEWVWQQNVTLIATDSPLVTLTGSRVPLATWEVTSYGVARLVCGLWCTGTVAQGLTVARASVIAAVVLVAMAVVAVRDRRTRGMLVACALLAAATYGIISVARGFFFLTLPAILHMATRYHYAALVPVTIALCVTLQSLARGWTLPRGLPIALVLLWAVGSVTALIIAPSWLRLSEEAREQTQQFIADMHAAAASSTTPAVYVRNRVFRELPLTGPVFPKNAALFTLYFRGDTLDDKRFYFVEPDDETRAYNAHGVPIGRLLIAPDYVPRGTVLR